MRWKNSPRPSHHTLGDPSSRIPTNAEGLLTAGSRWQHGRDVRGWLHRQCPALANPHHRQSPLGYWGENVPRPRHWQINLWGASVWPAAARRAWRAWASFPPPAVLPSPRWMDRHSRYNKKSMTLSAARGSPALDGVRERRPGRDEPVVALVCVIRQVRLRFWLGLIDFDWGIFFRWFRLGIFFKWFRLGNELLAAVRVTAWRGGSKPGHILVWNCPNHHWFLPGWSGLQIPTARNHFVLGERSDWWFNRIQPILNRGSMRVRTKAVAWHMKEIVSPELVALPATAYWSML
jgi:hypothetical protein